MAALKWLGAAAGIAGATIIALNLPIPEHEFWITHLGSGIRVPFGLIPINPGGSG